MTVLVTGGAGYIGSHMILELLDAGEPVIVLDNLSTGFEWAVAKPAHLIVGDVGDEFKPADPVAEPQPDGRLRLPGGMTVDDAATSLRAIWETDAATVGGLVTAALGHLPSPGETVRIGDWEFEVERVADKAVDSVLARRVRANDDETKES